MESRLMSFRRKIDAAITAVAHKKFEGLDIPALSKKSIFLMSRALLTEILLMEDYKL